MVAVVLEEEGAAGRRDDRDREVKLFLLMSRKVFACLEKWRMRMKNGEWRMENGN